MQAAKEAKVCEKISKITTAVWRTLKAEEKLQLALEAPCAALLHKTAVSLETAANLEKAAGTIAKSEEVVNTANKGAQAAEALGGEIQAGAAQAEKKVAQAITEKYKETIPISPTQTAAPATELILKPFSFNATSKAEALECLNNLPNGNLRHLIKKSIKKSSNSYNEFSLSLKDKNYLLKMTKPGNVPGSKAIYYKEISSTGETLKVFKDTFDNKGFLVHRKYK